MFNLSKSLPLFILAFALSFVHTAHSGENSALMDSFSFSQTDLHSEQNTVGNLDTYKDQSFTLAKTVKKKVVKKKVVKKKK